MFLFILGVVISVLVTTAMLPLQPGPYPVGPADLLLHGIVFMVCFAPWVLLSGVVVRRRKGQ